MIGAKARPLFFGYTWVSTEEQADKRNGLEAQRAAIDAEAERRGWDVEHYADEGASGNYINGNLREVLHLLASGQGDGLIVARLDRLARSVVDAANIIEDAQTQGWSLVVLDLSLDLTTAAGRMMARTVVSFAEYERELISERTKAGLAAKKRRGEPIGRPRLAGRSAPGRTQRRPAHPRRHNRPGGREEGRWDAVRLRRRVHRPPTVEGRSRQAQGAPCERYESTIKTHLLPAFGAKAVSAITVTDWRRSAPTCWRPGDPERSGTCGRCWTACWSTPASTWPSARYLPTISTARRCTTQSATTPVSRRTRSPPTKSPPSPGRLVSVTRSTGCWSCGVHRLRAVEVQGLEVRDVTLTTSNDGTVKGSVRVQRTKSRRKREWVTGTPKSKTSKRTVPLPPWLATRLAAYLADTHPFADTPTAVLWPRGLAGGSQYSIGRHHWTSTAYRARSSARPWKQSVYPPAGQPRPTRMARWSP